MSHVLYVLCVLCVLWCNSNWCPSSCGVLHLAIFLLGYRSYWIRDPPTSSMTATQVLFVNKWSSFLLRSYDEYKELGLQNNHNANHFLITLLFSISSLLLDKPTADYKLQVLICSFCVHALSHYNWFPTEVQVPWVLHMSNKQWGPRMVCNNSSIITHVLKMQHKIQLQGARSRDHHIITATSHTQQTVSCPLMIGQT